MKNFKINLIAITLFFPFFNLINAQTMKDFEGNDYKTVTIGNQVWISENLNTTHYRNGDLIPEVKTSTEWEEYYKKGKGAWCYYNNDLSNGQKYGKLYNWYAVNDPRGLAPSGMHIPTRKEWQTLITNLGGESSAFSKLKSSLGFSALAGGHRYFKDCSFNSVGVIGFWWSSTKEDTWSAWYQAVHFGYSQVGSDNGGMNTGMSVRCVVDK